MGLKKSWRMGLVWGMGMEKIDHKGKNFVNYRHCCIYHGCPKQCLVPSRHSINIGLIHGLMKEEEENMKGIENGR